VKLRGGLFLPCHYNSDSAQGDDDEDASDHSSSRKSIGLFNMNMEVDPKKLDEASDPEVNTLQLWLIVQKLFVAITRNYNEVNIFANIIICLKVLANLDTLIGAWGDQ